MFGPLCGHLYDGAVLLILRVRRTNAIHVLLRKKTMLHTISRIAFALVLLAAPALASDAETQKSPRMLTPWGEALDRTNVLPDYPRPQMVRDKWQNLNGEWDFALTSLGEAEPQEFSQRILVPFPVESALSGIEKAVRPDQAVWYRRSFEAEDLAAGERLLLHFGAVDWHATVWVNDKQVGEHRGGFDPFWFDITEALQSSGPHTLVVRVTDPTNKGTQPRGKQVLEPGGILYTAVTGIWQTVWLETVPASHITRVHTVPDVAAGEVVVTVSAEGNTDGSIVSVRVPRAGRSPLRGAGKVGEAIRVKVPNARLWSPDDPHLYDLEVTLAYEQPNTEAKVLDRVQSYFGMRSIELARDEQGVQRIFLNGEPLFQYGLLDQGWWPDGLYTAPTDEALRFDIEATKQMGFNMCRKHVKVEPARWYYWCDKLGLLVWQDMPSGDRAISPNEPDIVRSDESERVFRHELKGMIDFLASHPSVVVWVPFNEGWGQFKTNEILDWVKQYDSSRLVDGPSGWADRGEGDMHDMHLYPGPGMFPLSEGRASVLGEFGGYGLPVEGHLWQPSGNWGYHTYDSREQLLEGYTAAIDMLWYYKAQGLAAAVYTQTTDVEGEVNGLLTYDRKVFKIEPEVLAQLHKRLYEPSPRLRTLLAASNVPTTPGAQWRYTTNKPSDEWMRSEFDDSAWDQGAAGFGTPHTPGAVVRTEWNTSDIWIRRTVELPPSALRQPLYLYLHHDEDATIYINGQQVAKLKGYTTSYKVVPIEARIANQKGTLTVAVHCHQTSGGQYIDVGLIGVAPAAEGRE